MNSVTILFIIAVLLSFLVLKVSKDSAKNREYIRQHGGMRSVYSTIINGILEYSSAKVEEEDDNSITISGEFVDEKDGEKHGTWLLEIKHSFKIVVINYNTKIYYNDVVQGNKRWEFPTTEDQREMLHSVKSKMEEASAKKLSL